MIQNLDGLDPGVRDYVRILNAAGVNTYQSCQGGPGHSYPYCTVLLSPYYAASEGYRAHAVCLEHGLPLMSISKEWAIIGGEMTGPIWKLEFRIDAVEHDRNNVIRDLLNEEHRREGTGIR